MSEWRIDVVEKSDDEVLITSRGGMGVRIRKDAKLPTLANSGTHKRMTEPAIRDLARELDDPSRARVPELEVDIEVLDEALLDPWFLLTEEEIAQIEDDPSAKIYEVRITGYDDSIWAMA
jgi:hypothetical protein